MTDESDWYSLYRNSMILQKGKHLRIQNYLDFTKRGKFWFFRFWFYSITYWIHTLNEFHSSAFKICLRKRKLSLFIRPKNKWTAKFDIKKYQSLQLYKSSKRTHWYQLNNHKINFINVQGAFERPNGRNNCTTPLTISNCER